MGRPDPPATAEELLDRAKRAAGVNAAWVARPAGRNDGPGEVAACGAGSCGSLARSARARGASFFLTGEMRHHDALAATAAGMTVVCLGHSHSERLALKALAGKLAAALPELDVVLSARDRDPFEIA
jgi:putative NIF3 family GTP cyclohydrolase 1 type 2